MKKLVKSVLAMILAVIMIVPMTACNRDPGLVGGEPVEHSKTQLYVSNFNGGYGDEWLQKLAARFEEEYKDTSFEKDKMGVQVLVDSLLSLFTTTTS